MYSRKRERPRRGRRRRICESREPCLVVRGRWWPCFQCTFVFVFSVIYILFFYVLFFFRRRPCREKARIMSLRGLFSSPAEAQDTQFHYPAASLTFRKRETWQNETSVNAGSKTKDATTVKTIKTASFYSGDQRQTLCSLDLTNFQGGVTYHFTGDPVGALIHSEMDDGWHAHALSLVISLLNPLGSNYLRGEQKAGARQLLLTWQLDEQHSPLFYEANLQSSRNETRSNEGKCLDRQTQTTVTQAGAEHLSKKFGGSGGKDARVQSSG